MIDKYKALYDGSLQCIRVRDGSVIRDFSHEFSGREFLRHLMIPLETYLARVDGAVRVLDYGCGRGEMPWMNFSKYSHGAWGHFKDKIQMIYLFDPANIRLSRRPDGLTFDIVTCADVLEHVPEEEVGGVLADLVSFTTPDGCIILSIAGIPATKAFVDTHENLHCTQWPYERWVALLASLPRQIMLVYLDEHGKRYFQKLHPKYYL